MKRYHCRKNPNGTYGRCSQRKLTDFRYGDYVVRTVCAFDLGFGRRMSVGAIDLKRNVVWCSDPFSPYQSAIYPHMLEHESYWFANVE